MAVMISTATMIERLEPMIGTSDLNDWETGFVKNLAQHMHAGHVIGLTGPQVESLERLHAKHFGDG